MNSAPVLDDVLSTRIRISQFSKNGLLPRAARALNNYFLLKRVPADVDPRVGCWVPYLGKIAGQRFLLRRNEAVRRMVGDPAFPVCVTFRVTFCPVDAEGLANNEGPALDQLQTLLHRAICSSGSGIHAATITTSGIRLFVFYCRDMQVPQSVHLPFDEERLSVRCERDEEWSFFKAIA